MDMWNWLMDCHEDGSLTIEELQKVMEDDEAARNLWRDWSRDAGDFVHEVRDEVWPFILHLKKKAKNE